MGLALLQPRRGWSSGKWKTSKRPFGAGWSSSKKWTFNWRQMVQWEIKLTERCFCMFFYMKKKMFFNPRRMNKVVMRETEHRNKEKKKTSEHVFQWLQGPSLTPGIECRPKFRSSQRLPKKNMSKQRKMPQNQHEASVQSVETNRQFLEVTPLKLQSDFNQWLMDLWGKKKKKRQ